MSRGIQGIGKWRPGTSRTDSARDLVQEYILLTAGLACEEAAEGAGVGVATIRKWRRGAVSRLDARVRRRMQFYLSSTEGLPNGISADRFRTPRRKEALS